MCQEDATSARRKLPASEADRSNKVGERARMRPKRTAKNQLQLGGKVNMIVLEGSCLS